MLQVKQFTFSNFGVNTYLLVDSATKEAAVVDPAMQTERERNEFDRFVESHGIRLTQIINTHLHLDHCFGVNYVKDKYGLKLKASAADAPLGRQFPQQCELFRMPALGGPVELDVPLHDGDTVTIGESKLKVIATPGHTPGGICLYDEADHLLFVGDTLFKGSVGRTDLPGGNHAQLIDSIQSRLLSLPDNTTVFPGHDRLTNIANERRFNPYL